MRLKTSSWTTSYFVSDSHAAMSPADADSLDRIVDVLYVRVGELGPVSNRGVELQLSHPAWPAAVPRARAYVGQWHNVTRICPTISNAAEMACHHRRLVAEAERRGARVIGLQLDYDCPTISLPRYAAFLRELRLCLPAQDLVSITTRLDWLTPGTRVSEVMPYVDEHVPLLESRSPHGMGRIASHGASRWTPRFDALGRPYRIGIDPSFHEDVRSARGRLCSGVVLPWRERETAFGS